MFGQNLESQVNNVRESAILLSFFKKKLFERKRSLHLHSMLRVPHVSDRENKVRNGFPSSQYSFYCFIYYKNTSCITNVEMYCKERIKVRFVTYTANSEESNYIATTKEVQ